MKRTNIDNTFKSPITTNSQENESSTTIQTLAPSPRASETKLAIFDNSHDTHLINRTARHAKPTKFQILTNILTADSFFKHTDVIRWITEFLSYEDILNLLLINKAVRFLLDQFDRFQVALTLKPRAFVQQQNQIIEFAQNNNLPIKIRVITFEDRRNLIQFINNPDNLHHLVRIVLDLGEISKNNLEEIQDFLNLLATKADQLPNLKSFSCGAIYGIENSEDIEDLTLTIPEALKIESFSCGDIHCHLALNLPSSLLSFSCGNVESCCTVQFPEELNSLRSLSCGDLGENAGFYLPKEQLNNLTFLTCGDIDEDSCFNLPNQLDRLISFSCGNIIDNATLEFPEELNNLESLSLGSISIDLKLPQKLNSLISFSCGTFSDSLTLPKELNSLISFSCGDICSGTTCTLPELFNLKYFSCGELRSYFNPCNETWSFATLNFPHSLPNLIDLSFKAIGKNTLLRLPQDLTNLERLSFEVVYTNILPKELNKLKTLSFDKLSSDFSPILPQSLNNLESLTIEKIENNAFLDLPQSLGSKTKLVLNDVGDNAVIKLSKELFQQIDSFDTIGNNVYLILPTGILIHTKLTMNDVGENATIRLSKELFQQIDSFDTIGDNVSFILPTGIFVYMKLP